jgi:hypothetical protein
LRHETRWRRFLLANALGAVVWPTAVTAVGLAVGTQLDRTLRAVSGPATSGLRVPSPRSSSGWPFDSYAAEGAARRSEPPDGRRARLPTAQLAFLLDPALAPDPKTSLRRDHTGACDPADDMRPRDLAVVPDLERELDELYGLPLEGFTPARNDLAKRLRKAGQKDEADRVASLRKPPISAWAINQVARREPDGVRELLAAGKAVLDAQRQALAGKRSERFDEAGRRQRDAIKRLVRAAAGILTEAGHGPSAAVEERIASSLRAASVDSEGRSLLESGRLAADVESSGLDLLAAMAPARARPRRTPITEKRDDDGVRAARKALEAARETQRRLEREADEAAQDAGRAQAAAAEAAERADALAAEARRAAEAVEAAEGELGRLEGT